MLNLLKELTGPVYDVPPPFLEDYPDDAFGWDGDNPILSKIVEARLPLQIVEVGTWKGQSAFTMAEACRRKKLPFEMLCIDTWLGSTEHWFDHRHQMGLKHGNPHIYETFVANVLRRNLQDHILPFRATSIVGAEVLERLDIRADLIYLDAAHNEKDVYNDLTGFYPLLKETGLLFGHDLGAHAPGVELALRRFCLDKGLDYRSEGIFWFLSL